MISKAKIDRRLPFYAGQSADDTVKVVKRTGRTRRVLVVIDAHGEHRLEFKRHERKSDTKRWMEGQVELKSVKCVTEVYDDCTLVFEHSRGPDGKGTLCFRIAQILIPNSTQSTTPPQGTGFPPPDSYE